MRNLVFLMLIISFTSCATLVLKKDYEVQISSNISEAKAEIQDSIYDLPAEIRIKRSKEDLAIKLFNDSLEKDFVVKAAPNGTFLYANLIYYPIFPLVYGIDFTNPKRFYYGKTIFLNTNDSSSIIRPANYKRYNNYWSKNYPTKKGQLNLTFSLPWVNSFYLQPNEESSKVNTGFWGFSAGTEFYYQENKYLALNGGAVMDFFIPFPTAVDFSGEVEHMYSIYSSLTDNYRFRRFTLGYGINFSKNTWKLVYYNSFEPPPPTREPSTKSNNSLGITLDGYHQVGKYFFFGLIYRPTFLQVHPNLEFKYEHLISLDFKWKIRVKQ